MCHRWFDWFLAVTLEASGTQLLWLMFQSQCLPTSSTGLRSQTGHSITQVGPWVCQHPTPTPQGCSASITGCVAPGTGTAVFLGHALPTHVHTVAWRCTLLGGWPGAGTPSNPPGLNTTWWMRERAAQLSMLRFAQAIMANYMSMKGKGP